MAATPVMTKSDISGVESKSFQKVFRCSSDSIASSDTKSLAFLKQLLSIAVSNVAYLRALMPETAFRDRYLGDMHLKIIGSGKEGHPLARQIVRHMQACFEAIDLMYLKTLTMWFYEDRDRPDKVLEAYVFKFSYAEDKANVTMSRNQTVFAKTRSGQDIKESTVNFLTTLIRIVEELEPLPSTVFLKIQLSYHESRTPPDYHPAGFHDAETNLIFDDAATKSVAVGGVASNHHALSLRLKTAQSSLSWTGTSLDPNWTYGLDFDGTEEAEVECLESEDAGQADASAGRAKDPAMIPGQNVTAPAQPPAIDPSQPSIPPETQMDVDCICRGVKDGEMISCQRCEKWQHAICYGIFPNVASQAVEHLARHVCVSCADATPEGSCLDPGLKGMTEDALKQKALFRRAVLATATSELKCLTITLLRHRLEIDEESARAILVKMTNLKLLQPGSEDDSAGLGERSFVVSRRELEAFIHTVAKKMRQIVLGETKKARGTKRKARAESEV